MLSELKTILQTSKTATIVGLARSLNTDVHVVRDMLQIWIRKGLVRRCANVPGCGKTCQKCNPELVESYEWLFK